MTPNIIQNKTNFVFETAKKKGAVVARPSGPERLKKGRESDPSVP